MTQNEIFFLAGPEGCGMLVEVDGGWSSDSTNSFWPAALHPETPNKRHEIKLVSLWASSTNRNALPQRPNPICQVSI